MKVSVVIPTWDKKELLDGALKSLDKQTFTDFEIVLVDNGSVDGTAEFVSRKFPNVNIVALGKNYGFAGGVNRGIKASRGEYIALLNNDAEADPHWLAELVKTMDANESLGFVTGKILNIRSSDAGRLIDSTGDFMSTWGFAYPRGRDEVDSGQYDNQATIFSVSGGASLYRKAVLDDIGLFDERFFAYMEDVDLSFRGQLAGYKAAFNPKAIVYHHIGATSGGGQTHFTRYHYSKNLFMLYFKNMPGFLFIKYLPLFVASLFLSFLSSLKHGFLMTHLKSALALVIFFPGLCVARFKIQRRRRVSISYIDKLLIHGMPPLQKKYYRRYFPFLR